MTALIKIFSIVNPKRPVQFLILSSDYNLRNIFEKLKIFSWLNMRDLSGLMKIYAGTCYY